MIDLIRSAHRESMESSGHGWGPRSTSATGSTIFASVRSVGRHCHSAAGWASKKRCKCIFMATLDLQRRFVKQLAELQKNGTAGRHVAVVCHWGVIRNVVGIAPGNCEVVPTKWFPHPDHFEVSQSRATPNAPSEHEAHTAAAMEAVRAASRESGGRKAQQLLGAVRAVVRLEQGLVLQKRKKVCGFFTLRRAHHFVALRRWPLIRNIWCPNDRPIGITRLELTSPKPVARLPGTLVWRTLTLGNDFWTGAAH